MLEFTFVALTAIVLSMITVICYGIRENRRQEQRREMISQSVIVLFARERPEANKPPTDQDARAFIYRVYGLVY